MKLTRRICVLPQDSEVNCESDATPPAEALLNIALHYDKAGNVTIWRDTGKQERLRFEYDSLNRLIAATPLPVGGWQPALAAYTETYVYNAIGNFVSKGGVTQWYSDTAHVHAVTHFNGDRRAWYDQNGNMTQRVEVSGSQRITYTQEWDVENRLVAVTNTVAGQVTRFYRDAENRLVAVTNTVAGQVTRFYRDADGALVKSRQSSVASSQMAWLHGDHLGSAGLTTNASGQKVAELRYLPFGETRWAWGTTPTDRRYTGQRELAGVGLYDYNARMYWPAACPERSRRAGRFVSADMVVPGPGKAARSIVHAPGERFNAH